MKVTALSATAPYSLVQVYRRFRGACCLYHGALVMKATSTSETSVNFYQTIWRYRPEDNHLLSDLYRICSVCLHLEFLCLSKVFCFLHICKMSRGSSVSTVSDYGLDGRGSIPDRGTYKTSNLCVQTGCGAHPASYTMGTGGTFPGGKERPGRDADHFYCRG
jgi:hypothetical protein